MRKTAYTDVGFPLIGGYINLTLFGVTLAQAWIYFICFRRDPWGMKVVVVILCVGDMTNTLALCVALYQWLIERFDPRVLLPAFLAELETSTITAIVSQMSFAWRVQKVRHQWWLTVTICCWSLAGLISATVSVAAGGNCGLVENLYKIQPPMLIWSACFVACDLITATALYLVLRRSATGFGNTDNTIDRIKNTILQTSGLTMAIDLTHLIIVAFHPNYMLHFMANAVVSKVYANALLPTLTTRNSNHQLLGDDSVSIVLTRDPGSSPGSRGNQGRDSTSAPGSDVASHGQISLAHIVQPQWWEAEKDLAHFKKEGFFRGPLADAPMVTTVQHVFTSSPAGSAKNESEGMAGQNIAEDEKSIGLVHITSHHTDDDSAYPAHLDDDSTHPGRLDDDSAHPNHGDDDPAHSECLKDDPAHPN